MFKPFPSCGSVIVMTRASPDQYAFRTSSTGISSASGRRLSINCLTLAMVLSASALLESAQGRADPAGLWCAGALGRALLPHQKINQGERYDGPGRGRPIALLPASVDYLERSIFTEPKTAFPVMVRR